VKTLANIIFKAKSGERDSITVEDRQKRMLEEN
jgi:hypothetical protein